MRKIAACMAVIIITVIFVLASVRDINAETAKQYSLAAGGYLGIGGATEFFIGRGGAFALGIQPEVQFFIFDNISLTYRLLWERIFYEARIRQNLTYKVIDAPIDYAPFLLGIRYYIKIIDKLKAPVGMDLGCTWYKADMPGAASEARFAIDFYAGLEYEIIDNLGLSCMFNILMPNIAPLDRAEVVISRFMFFFGVMYYIRFD